MLPVTPSITTSPWNHESGRSLNRGIRWTVQRRFGEYLPLFRADYTIASAITS